MNRKASLTIAAMVSGLVLSASPASALVAVIDNQVASNTANAVNAINQQLSELKKITSLNTDIFNSVGKFGTIEDLRTLSQWQDFKDGGSMAEALASFGPNTCAVVACGTGGQQADLAQLSDARSWVDKSFFINKAPSLSDQSNLTKVRSKAMVESSMSGYSMALMARENLTKAKKSSQDLESLVAGATDLRTDMRANSAIAIAQHQVMVQQLAMLTSLVEMQASQQLASSSDFIDASGASSPPQVYDPKDYDPITGSRLSASKDDEGNATGAAAANPAGATGSSTSSASTGTTYRSGSSSGTTAGTSVIPTTSSGSSTITSGIFSGSSSAVQTDPSYSDLANQLIQAGVQTLRQKGNSDAANVLGNIGSSLTTTQSNPYGVVWSSASAQSYGNSGLYSVVQNAQQAAYSGDTAQMNSLIATAQQVAQTSGDPNALSIMQQTTQTWAQGGTSQSQTVALNSAYVISQYGGYSNSSAVSNTLLLDPTKASQQQLYQLGTQTAQSFSQSLF